MKPSTALAYFSGSKRGDGTLSDAEIWRECSQMNGPQLSTATTRAPRRENIRASSSAAGARPPVRSMVWVCFVVMVFLLLHQVLIERKS